MNNPRFLKNQGLSAVVSHISRKTSEMWDTQDFCGFKFEPAGPRYATAEMRIPLANLQGAQHSSKCIGWPIQAFFGLSGRACPHPTL